MPARPRAAPPARLRPRRRDGAREQELLAVTPPRRRRRSSTRSTTRSRGSSTCSARSGTCGSTSLVAVAVIVAALSRHVTKIELIALLLAIAFVLIAEMINTAIEGAIDVATTSFDPMAKLAKDVAAGAVLIATINALAVGYLVFSAGSATARAPARPAARRAGRADAPRARAHGRRGDRAKAWTGPRDAAARRRALGPRGGRVRGVDRGDVRGRRPTTASSSRRSRSCMALLVAQTRVEAGVHSALEVALGGAARLARPPSALFQLAR